jgi:hypothetical protein
MGFLTRGRVAPTIRALLQARLDLSRDQSAMCSIRSNIGGSPITGHRFALFQQVYFAESFISYAVRPTT